MLHTHGHHLTNSGFFYDLHDLSAELEGSLLDLAYAGEQHWATEDPGKDHPFLLSTTHTPGRTPSIDECISALGRSPAAHALRAWGMDPAFVIMAEILRLEQCFLGPENGILRCREVHCPAWERAYESLAARTTQPLWESARRCLDERNVCVPPPLLAHWQATYHALLDAAAARPGSLRRLAADSCLSTARYQALPQPVRGASLHGIEISAEPTLDGQALVLAKRTYLGLRGELVARPSRARIQLIQPELVHEINVEITAEQTSVVWYEANLLAPVVEISAWLVTDEEA